MNEVGSTMEDGISARHLRNPIRILSVLAITLSQIGCAFWQVARIDRFEVQPNEVCPENSVRVTASVAGSGTVWARPVRSQVWDIGVPITDRWPGADIQAADADFVVLLRGDGNGAYTQRSFVHVVREGRSYPVRLSSPRCEGGMLVFSGTVVADGLAPSLRLYAVEASRPIQLAQGGVGPVDIPAGIDALRGRPIVAPWTVRMPAAAGECGPADTSSVPVPAGLSVTLFATCDGQAPTSQPAHAARSPTASGCGNDGQMCCNERPEGRSCWNHGICQIAGGTCSTAGSPPPARTTCSRAVASPSAMEFSIFLRDEHGCIGTYGAFANDREEAVGCARSAAASEGHRDVTEPTAQPTYYPVCLLGPTGLSGTQQFFAASEDDARQCAAATTANATVVRDGCGH